MKKVLLLSVTLLLAFILNACNPDTSQYAGVFELESYTSSVSDEDLGFKVIEKYNIELDSKGLAKQTVILGVMLHEESFTSGYNVDLELNEIYFVTKINTVENYTDTYYYDNDTIIINDMDVAIKDNPNINNPEDYVRVTIRLKRVVN